MSFYQGLDQSQPIIFSGTEIRSQQSELGTILTVTLQIILATGEETKLTLLLPPLHATLEEVPIKTLAIGTKSINPTMGPPIEGQLLTYRVFHLEGNRKLIFYQ